MIRPKSLLLLTLGFAFLGVLLSGYLSYWNLFGPSCHQGPLNWLVSCGGPKKVLIFGQPTCIYGFGMFLTVFILALINLVRSPKRTITAWLVGLGIAGTLFSGGLTIYEVFFLRLSFTGLPTCIYGLAFYAGVLITSTLAYRKIASHDQILAM